MIAGAARADARLLTVARWCEQVTCDGKPGIPLADDIHGIEVLPQS